jgi:nucleotide-binding universal stress UspA family protein
MTVLVATDSVHVTAAACDYLADREPDTVFALAVGVGERDAADAFNVLSARLPGAETETLLREGDPAEVIPAVAAEVGAETVVLGRTGTVGDTGLGSVAAAVLATLDRPAVVVPV